MTPADRPYYEISPGVMLYELLDAIMPDFYTGSAIKYICRCRRKHALPLEDLSKAATYLRRLDGHAVFTVRSYPAFRRAVKLIQTAEYLDDWQRKIILGILTLPVGYCAQLIEYQIQELQTTATKEGE